VDSVRRRVLKQMHPDLLRAWDGGEAWTEYLEEQLANEERDRVYGWFMGSDTLRIAKWQVRPDELNSEGVDLVWRMWVSQVLRIEVTMTKYATRLHDPLLPHVLEIDWRRDPRSGAIMPIRFTRTALQGAFLSLPLTIPSTWDDSWLVMWNDEPDLLFSVVLDPFLGALQLHLDRYGHEDFKGIPDRRPEKGQPPDLAFYKRVVTRHQVLTAEGHPDPTARLAQQLTEELDKNVDRAAVRQYLRRGRRYLEREAPSGPRPEQMWRPPREEGSDARK